MAGSSGTRAHTTLFESLDWAASIRLVTPASRAEVAKATQQPRPTSATSGSHTPVQHMHTNLRAAPHSEPRRHGGPWQQDSSRRRHPASAPSVGSFSVLQPTPMCLRVAGPPWELAPRLPSTEVLRLQGRLPLGRALPPFLPRRLRALELPAAAPAPPLLRQAHPVSRQRLPPADYAKGDAREREREGRSRRPHPWCSCICKP